MQTKIIGLKKYIRIIGIITMVFFAVIAIGFAVTESLLALVFLSPFIILGITLILAHKKEKIIIEADRFVISHFYRKAQTITYDSIGCMLLIPVRDSVNMALIDNEYKRIADIEGIYDDIDILLDTLKQNNIKFVDFGRLVDEKKDVTEYLRALNAIERNYYKSVINENSTVDDLCSEELFSDIERTRKKLKITGWIMTALVLISWFTGGKIGWFIIAVIPLYTYMIYIRYYPYIYFENITKKGEEKALSLPLLGAGIAYILCVNMTFVFNFDYIDLFKMALIMAAILEAVYIIKSKKIRIPQQLSRKVAVGLAICAISLEIVFPLNYVLTFDKPAHENMIVTGKVIDTQGKYITSYYLDGIENGEKVRLNVSKKVYDDTSVNDEMRVCISESIFGWKYSRVHK